MTLNPSTIGRVALGFALAFIAPAARAHETSAIEVSVTHLHSTKGTVWVCLWKEGQASGFPDCGKSPPMASLSAPAAAPVVVFPNVAPGAYALSIFHDEYNTGKPEVNFVGLPKSGVGTSNNPDISVLSLPSFEKSRFVVPGATRQVVEAKYLF